MVVMSAPPESEYVNALEASRILGVSLPTLIVYLEAGDIPARKLRRRWVINRKSLETWATSGNQAGASDGSR